MDKHHLHFLQKCEKMYKTDGRKLLIYNLFTFMHLADAFIQSDLQGIQA